QWWAGGGVHGKDIDLLGGRVRYIDHRIRHRLRHGFSSRDQGARQRDASEPERQHSPPRHPHHCFLPGSTPAAFGALLGPPDARRSSSATRRLWETADMSILAGRAQARMLVTLRSATVKFSPSRFGLRPSVPLSTPSGCESCFSPTSAAAASRSRSG